MRNLKVDSIEVVDNDATSKSVNVKYTEFENVQLTLSYKFFSDGMVTIAMEMDAAESTPDMIRFGVELGVPSLYSNTTFYGRGPFENYIDRKRAAKMGEYTLATSDLFFNYVQPQESGNRSDVESLTLSRGTSKKGQFQVHGAPSFNFSAWEYSAENIETAKHPYELQATGYYTLNIDQEQAALAGTLSDVLPHYELKAGKRKFEFTFGTVK